LFLLLLLLPLLLLLCLELYVHAAADIAATVSSRGTIGIWD